MPGRGGQMGWSAGLGGVSARAFWSLFLAFAFVFVFALLLA